MGLFLFLSLMVFAIVYFIYRFICVKNAVMGWAEEHDRRRQEEADYRRQMLENSARQDVSHQMIVVNQPGSNVNGDIVERKVIYDGHSSQPEENAQYTEAEEVPYEEVKKEDVPAAQAQPDPAIDEVSNAEAYLRLFENFSHLYKDKFDYAAARQIALEKKIFDKLTYPEYDRLINASRQEKNLPPVGIDAIKRVIISGKFPNWVVKEGGFDVNMRVVKIAKMTLSIYQAYKAGKDPVVPRNLS